MKSAQEILKIREEKRQQMIRGNAELVNMEMLQVEKILNKYENNIKDDKDYVIIPLIIRTKEVKNLLKEKGYIIDKVSNDIEVNTTRIWLSEESYKKATSNLIGYRPINITVNNSNKSKSNNQTTIESETESTLNENTIDKLLENILRNSQYGSWR